MSKRRTRWKADEFTSAVDAPVERGYATMAIAGAGSRFIATLMDMFIIATLQASVLVTAYLIRPELMNWQVAWISVVGFVLLNVVYSLLFELVTNGQTPGKNAAGIRVLAADGFPASAGQIITRNLLRLIDILPIGYLLGGVACAFHPLSQRYGDRVARTLVVYDTPLRELLSQSDIPNSLYSTSADGYILEAFLLRLDQLSTDVVLPLGHQLATYYYRKYPPDEPELQSQYAQGRYLEFLQELYRAEKQAQVQSQLPGLPSDPTVG